MQCAMWGLSGIVLASVASLCSLIILAVFFKIFVCPNGGHCEDCCRYTIISYGQQHAEESTDHWLGF